MHWLGEATKKTALSPIKLRIHAFAFLISLFIAIPAIISGAEQLSPRATISILTCGPGEPLYAAFGHTALLVSDPENGIDKVFNYGTFDVSTPNFYLKFLTGRLLYALSVSDYESFLEEYRAENRWVYSQELLISPSQKQKIYDSLAIVMDPENRFYKYDFFRNNCSTKVIDLVLWMVAEPQVIDTLRSPSGKTFRQALEPYIGGRAWLSLGINTLLGPFADQPMSKLQSTYLPDNLMHVVEAIQLTNTSSKILGGGFQPPVRSDPNLAMILFWALAFILVFEALWAKSSVATTNRVDAVLFSLAGFFGLLFIFFWAWSDHVSLHVNLNLFWSSPLNFVLAWAIYQRRKTLTKVFSIAVTLLMFFMLINWSRLPQKFPLELMPVVTALVFRAVNRIFNFKAKEKILPSNSVN